MDLSLTQNAVDLARERGRVMALDFIPPLS
jgi:hypothetical protein